jgi:hypothetical protein
MEGLACANLTKHASAIAIKKSTEMKPAVKNVFLLTGNPCLIMGCFCVKSVFVKVS